MLYCGTVYNAEGPEQVGTASCQRCRSSRLLKGCGQGCAARPLLVYRNVEAEVRERQWRRLPWVMLMLLRRHKGEGSWSAMFR